MFDSKFQQLQASIKTNTDLSNDAKFLFRIISKSNHFIYKEDTYGVNRGCLKSFYAKPLTLMYDLKSAMCTSLLLFVVQNKSRFAEIESRARCDERNRRVIDILYNGQVLRYNNGKQEVSYHMPETVQVLKPLCTCFDDNFTVSSEDKIMPDGSENQNYDRSQDKRPSSMSPDYNIPLMKLKEWLSSVTGPNTKQMEQQRRKAAEEGLKKGYIIPVFKSEDKPCIVKAKVKGKDAYNAIPNVLENTKNDYLLRDEKTNELVWFLNYKIDGDRVEFSDSIPSEEYLGEIKIDGNFACLNYFSEMIKRVVTEILNESYLL